jgi:hypothetical protein
MAEWEGLDRNSRSMEGRHVAPTVVAAWRNIICAGEALSDASCRKLLAVEARELDDEESLAEEVGLRRYQSSHFPDPDPDPVPVFSMTARPGAKAATPPPAAAKSSSANCARRGKKS